MKDKKDNILFELRETCNFQNVFWHYSKAPDSLSSAKQPDAQIGHIRAYFDGRQWQGDYFPCRNALRTEGFNRESQDIYGCLVTQIYSLDVLRRFCEKHPLAKAGENEYNFFMNGHAADYWIRFITRERDYNLYLKAFAKNFSNAEK